MKTPTPEQLRLAAEIIEAGCEWECRTSHYPDWLTPHLRKDDSIVFSDFENAH